MPGMLRGMVILRLMSMGGDCFNGNRSSYTNRKIHRLETSCCAHKKLFGNIQRSIYNYTMNNKLIHYGSGVEE